MTIVLKKIILLCTSLPRTLKGRYEYTFSFSLFLLSPVGLIIHTISHCFLFFKIYFCCLCCSYDKNYKVLLDSMVKNDLALKGTFEGVELLIFPSNQLPENCQRKDCYKIEIYKCSIVPCNFTFGWTICFDPRFTTRQG